MSKTDQAGQAAVAEVSAHVAHDATRAQTLGRAILIPVHWSTDFGGLQDNVLDTVCALREAGWRPVLIAPAARFNERFLQAGATVLEDDLADAERAARRALEAGPFALVHAHPFAARAVGALVAREAKVPLVLTIHGQYPDDLAGGWEKYDQVIVVSEALVDLVRETCPIDPARISVIPNAVDERVFRPRLLPILSRAARSKRVVAVASRLDPDKVTLFRALSEVAQYLSAPARCAGYQLRLHGQNLYGDTRGQLEPVLAHGSEGLEIVQTGWVSEPEDLARDFNEADVVFASGRAAMQSLACGVPTVAVASRGFVGLLGPENLELASRTNFGGFECDQTRFHPGAAIEALEAARRQPVEARWAARSKLLELHSRQKIARLHQQLVEGLAGSSRAQV